MGDSFSDDADKGGWACLSAGGSAACFLGDSVGLRAAGMLREEVEGVWRAEEPVSLLLVVLVVVVVTRAVESVACWEGGIWNCGWGGIGATAAAAAFDDGGGGIGAGGLVGVEGLENEF